MRRLLPLLLLCAFSLATSGASCGGGGAAEDLARWVGRWSDDAARGQHKPPPEFKVPTPPSVALPSVATQIANDVGSARAPLAELRAQAWNEGTQEAAAFTQGVLCEWFSWYVEDPATRPVQGSDEFLALFASGALKVNLPTPPDQRFKDAVELFRNAIKRGQGLGQDASYAAMAAACSVPLEG